MEENMAALQSCDTWELVNPLSCVKVVGGRWKVNDHC